MEWSKALISSWINQEDHSRGKLYLIQKEMDINIDDVYMRQLINEYESEEDDMAKWAYSILVMNNHKQAEKFYHLHCDHKDVDLDEDFLELKDQWMRPHFGMFFKANV